VPWIKGVAADVALADPHDRDARRLGETGQPVQMPVDGQGFPAGVGKIAASKVGIRPWAARTTRVELWMPAPSDSNR
jgi:hypothetical protein